MVRRRKLLAAVLMVNACLVGLATNALARQVDRPNVLLITADDMNRDSVGAYGCPVPGTTPQIDRLATQGLRFQHAHVSIAICQPCRAVWMTGRYPQNNGALGFDKIKSGIPTLPETLREHGYLTGILGKTKHVIPSRTEAFDFSRNRWELHNGRDKDRYAAFAKEFFRQSATEQKPFFLMVNLHDPHRPFDKRQPRADRKLPTGVLGKTKKDIRGFDFPPPSRLFRPEEIVVPGFLTDVPDIRQEMARYYSSVRRADDGVGELLSLLESENLVENTVVIFLSDHGIAVPFAKTNCWRHSTITPLIIRWPGHTAANGVDDEHLVSGIDLAPTILDAVGATPMNGIDGKSFLGTLSGKKLPGFDHVYTQINSLSSRKFFRMRAVQDKQYGLIWNEWSNGETRFRNESMAGLSWKALVNAAASDAQVAARVQLYQYRKPFEFYDYTTDPDALVDLSDDPERQSQIDRYRQLLTRMLQQTSDPLLPKLQAQIESSRER